MMTDIDSTSTHGNGTTTTHAMTDIDLNDDIDDVWGNIPVAEEGEIHFTSATTGVVHDQLPSLEDVKIDAARASASGSLTSRGVGGENKMGSVCGINWSWKRLWCLSAVVLAFIGLIVGLSVGLSNSSSSSEDETTTVNRLESTKNFLLHISNPSDLSNTSSPQYKALHWISNIDSRKVPIPTKLDSTSKSTNKFVQRYTLAVLYYATNGVGWIEQLNFLSSKDECNWFDLFLSVGSYQLLDLGVQCHDEDMKGIVNDIWIPLNNMTGTLPPEIGYLSHLKFFDLPRNNIGGTLPLGISYLTQLASLDLQYNRISGIIPKWIYNLQNLRVLFLSNNVMDGLLERHLEELQELRLLGLDDNALSGDLLPILNLDNLQYLYLEDNAFVDTIDEDYFSGLPNLIQLDLSTNQINGIIPQSLFTLSTLSVLDLHDNAFSGHLPQVIPTTQDTKLRFLALHKNKLTGPIHSSISNLTALEHLDLSHNNFYGILPNEIGNLTEVEYLFLGANNYTPSPIPTFLSQMTKLRELSLKQSNLISTIPQWIGTSLDRLKVLDLDENELIGTIPESLGNLTQLLVLLLNRNELNETVPESFVNLEFLEVLVLDNNTLTGDINFMCNRKDRIDLFTADCKGDDDEPEIDCACCHICCNDNEVCNDRKWLANYNPIWEENYNRRRYRVDVSPSSSKEP